MRQKELYYHINRGGNTYEFNQVMALAYIGDQLRLQAKVQLLDSIMFDKDKHKELLNHILEEIKND
jgi:hypothetical protein